MKNVGKTIRSARRKSGLTLPALASRAGISKGLLSKLENARQSNPTLDTLCKIAKALDEPLCDLIRRMTT